MEVIKRFVIEEEGADAAEYALVCGLVALAITVGAVFLGGKLNSAFNTIGDCVSNAMSSSTASAC